MTDEPSNGTAQGAVPTRRETVCESDRPLDILLIDDNPMNQQTIGFMIDRMGHDTTVAGDALSGIEKARNTYFDIILMDIQMPDMDGLEATRRLRAEPGVSGLRPIIAITGDAEPGHRNAYKQAGMDGCVEKPIDNGLLARTFDEVMGEAMHHITEREVPLTPEEIAREEADRAAAATRDDSVAAFLASLQAIAPDSDG